MKTLARQRDQAEILARLRRLQSGSPRRWGRMSAQQMVCHLADSFRMITGQKPVRPIDNPFTRTVLKWIALHAPLPWPGGIIPTCPEIDQERGGTPPADFADDVARLEEVFQQVTSRRASFDARPHPLFGSMSEAAWLRWGYLHMDHHLRQFGA
jgi:hypothetical protein